MCGIKLICKYQTGGKRGLCPIQGPPKKEQVPTDGVDTLPVSSTVTMLRHVCKRRLMMVVEYGLKRGTTDNSYLIQVHPQCSLFVVRHAIDALGPMATLCAPSVTPTS